MKNSFGIFLSLGFILCACCLFAESELDNPGFVPPTEPGMEARKINNDVTLLVPKGGKMYRTNQTTYTEEGADTYAGRKFFEVDKRLDRIDRDIQEIKDAVLYLKAKLNDTGKGANEDLPKDTER